MTARRDEAKQGPPSDDVDYRGFPRHTAKAGARWYREHGAMGAWYFAAGPGGRFNLDEPRGTLYLANHPAAAARERVGPDIAEHGGVAASLVAQRYVSELTLTAPVVAAQLTSDRALKWRVVANELATMTPYDIPRMWARAFDEAGFEGIWGTLRFSGPEGRCLSVFGERGARDWPADEARRPLREVLGEMDIAVVDPPHEDQLTVLPPG